MVAQRHPSSECPSCGRFVGPQPRCPYCGVDVGQRLSIRILKVGSLVLALGGLAVLLFAATRADVPAVEIGSVVGTMNWAFVRIEGQVSRQPAFDPIAGNLSFWVKDGSGEIMVTAYHPESEGLLSGGLVPVMGDLVTIEGSLRVKDDFRYLILEGAKHVQIYPPDPVDVSVAEAISGELYQKVRIKGEVRDLREPYEGFHILTLRDATGEIDVALSESSPDLAQHIAALQIGQPLQVAGAIDQYRGAVQISVGQGLDLVPLDEPISIAPPRDIGELSVQDAGSMVTVEGTVARVAPFSSGVKLRIDDENDSVTLLLWQDLYESLPQHDALIAGATLRACGVVSEYRGDLEVVPQLPSDITLLARAEAGVPELKIGELGPPDVGRIVRVEGVLRSLRSFSAGVKGQLDDGTGMTTLLLWQEVYDSLPDPALLAPGAVLCIEGDLREYRGELEIVPRTAGDVVVTGKVALPALSRSMGQISTDDIGQTLQLEGRITDAFPFSQGWKFRLEDSSGTMILLLWQNLYEQLADSNRLSVGSNVSVRGTVSEYLGELEIVPQVPSDLTMLASGERLVPELPTATVSATVVAQPVPTTTLSTEAAAFPPHPTAEVEETRLPGPSPTRTLPPTPIIETRAIGDIAGSDVGSVLSITRARVSSVDHFSAGVKYVLDDGSGTIILLLWQNILEEIPDRHDLVPGSQVQVTGRIEEYQGDLEIIPRQGTDLVLLTQGEHMPIEGHPANDVTAADEGRVLVVEGIVRRVEGDGWIKIWLQDASGEILVFVPERVVTYLPAGIGAGVRLRVLGEVDVYGSVVEIIPLAGADVEVY